MNYADPLQPRRDGRSGWFLPVLLVTVVLTILVTKVVTADNPRPERPHCEGCP